MKIRYFADTDTLYIEFRDDGGGAGTGRLTAILDVPHRAITAPQSSCLL